MAGPQGVRSATDNRSASYDRSFVKYPLCASHCIALQPRLHTCRRWTTNAAFTRTCANRGQAGWHCVAIAPPGQVRPPHVTAITCTPRYTHTTTHTHARSLTHMQARARAQTVRYLSHMEEPKPSGLCRLQRTDLPSRVASGPSYETRHRSIGTSATKVRVPS